MLKSLQFLCAVFICGLTSSCHTQTPGSPNALNGKWYLEFNSSDIGTVRVFMTFESKDSTFTGYTRQGADRDILGFWKSTLGRLFTSDFKHGALLNVTNGKCRQRGDTLLFSAIFRSALGSYYFRGHVYKGELNVRLLNAKLETRGSIKGSKNIPAQALCNYPGLMDKTLMVTRNNIYNRSVFTGSDWKNFEKDIKNVSTRMQDDLEMEFAFYYFAGKLPFSHYALMRTQADTTSKGNTATPEEKQVLLEEKQPGTMYMNIKTFSGSAAEMDSAFAIITQKQCSNLIVDLRNNPGGNIESGMSLARHLADSAFYGGIFLTQKWFEKNSAPPAVNAYTGFPAFTEENYDLLINGIHNQQGLCLKVTPETPVYKGRLYILIGPVTASTCEPIVYWLKQNKRAVLVGSQTAGAMLNGEFFKLNDGFSVFLPTADYYTSDGYRLDKKGVSPNVVVEQNKALEYVMRNLIKQ